MWQLCLIYSTREGGVLTLWVVMPYLIHCSCDTVVFGYCLIQRDMLVICYKIMWQECEEDSSYQDNLTWNKKLFIFFLSNYISQQCSEMHNTPITKIRWNRYMYLLTYSGKTMKIHPHGSISIGDAGTQKPKLSLEGTTAN